MDSYSGDGFLGDMTPGLGLDDGIGLGMYCKLALLPCPPFPPRFAASPAVGVRPSLGASLPYDMIDSDLACPLTALFGILTGTGALCSPPPCLPTAPLMTLSDNAGLCPFFCDMPDKDADRLGGRWAFACTMDDLLLCTPAWVATTDCLLSPLAADAWDATLSLACSGGSATFLKVMIHSTSSPAYTFGSLQRTKARIFEGGAGGGIVRMVGSAGCCRNTLYCGHS